MKPPKRFFTDRELHQLSILIARARARPPQSIHFHTCNSFDPSLSGGLITKGATRQWRPAARLSRLKERELSCLCSRAEQNAAQTNNTFTLTLLGKKDLQWGEYLPPRRSANGDDTDLCGRRLVCNLRARYGD